MTPNEITDNSAELWDKAILRQENLNHTCILDLESRHCLDLISSSFYKMNKKPANPLVTIDWNINKTIWGTWPSDSAECEVAQTLQFLKQGYQMP
jgi:hypothetical protein